MVARGTLLGRFSGPGMGRLRRALLLFALARVGKGMTRRSETGDRVRRVLWPRVTIGVLGCLSGMALCEQVPAAGPSEHLDAVPGEIVVRYRGDTAPFRVIRGLGRTAIPSLVRSLRARRDVIYAEPNGYARLQAVPNDPGYAHQWNFRSTAPGAARIDGAWEVLATAGWIPGAGARVGVLDSGVAHEDYLDSSNPNFPVQFVTAPDFAGTHFLHSRNVIRGNEHANDAVNHGTHVAGTIAAGVNDGVGAAGIAPGATVMPVLATTLSPTSAVVLPHSAIAEGIRWLADHDAHVINMSFGGTVAAEVVADAVDYARSKGCLLVGAAGNTGESQALWPAAYDAEVLGVTGGDYLGNLAYYSAYGKGVAVMAPGGYLFSDHDGDLYADGIIQQTFLYRGNPTQFVNNDQQGTSMAAAHVSGIAALAAGVGVTDGSELRALLQATAHRPDRRPYDGRHGWGRVDARAVVESALAGPLSGPSRQLRVEAVQLVPRQEQDRYAGEAKARISDESFRPLAGVAVKFLFTSGKFRATQTAVTDTSGLAQARGLSLVPHRGRRMAVKVVSLKKEGYRFSRPLSAELSETAVLPSAD